MAWQADRERAYLESCRPQSPADQHRLHGFGFPAELVRAPSLELVRAPSLELVRAPSLELVRAPRERERMGSREEVGATGGGTLMASASASSPGGGSRRLVATQPPGTSSWWGDGLLLPLAPASGRP